MNPQLVLDAVAIEIIMGAQRSIGIDQIFGNQKQRYASRSRRRIRQAGQCHMQDIVGKIMFAIGDKDLLARNPIRAIPHRFGTGAQGVEVRSGLRFGQVHRAHPRPRYQLFKIGLFQGIRAM